MKERHRAIRALLQEMSPNKAIGYIKAFNLPEYEEKSLILLDVQKKGTVSAGEKMGMADTTIKKYRAKAYAHIADEIYN